MSASEEPSRHVCSVCGRSYKAAETLNRHRKNHSATCQYNCEICEASFKRNDLLHRHRTIHAPGRPPTSRSRNQRACDRCSRLKTRCDILSPCTRCTRAGHTCVYTLRGSRARTDRSSTASTGDTAMDSRSPNSIDIGLEEPHFDTVNSWQPPWQGHAYQWPEMESNLHPQSMRHLSSTPETTCCIPNMASWNGALDPQLFDGRALLPLPPLDSDPDSPCSGSSSCPMVILDGPTSSTQYDFEDPSYGMDPSPAAPGHEWKDNTISMNDSSFLPPPALDNINTSLRQPVGPHQVINELCTLATNFTRFLSHPRERTRLWHEMSQRISTSFTLYIPAPPLSETHLLQHFLDLLFENFHASNLSPEQRFASPESHPPHLYLVMTAIGANYAGPVAENYHFQMMCALQNRFLQVFTQKSPPAEDMLGLVQTLALLQTATLTLGNRSTMSSSGQLNEILVGLARRGGLFDFTGKVCTTMNSTARGKLATEVRKLDEAVSLLVGRRPLLASMETMELDPILSCGGNDWGRTIATGTFSTLDAAWS